MIQEFLMLREGKFEEEMPDTKCLIDMFGIDYIYPGTIDREEGKTGVVMKSGHSLMICKPFDEFTDIWKTCVEPINLNQ